MSDINVTPMVDVMLVLLVIFMVAAPLLTVGVPINLPKSSSAQTAQPQDPLIVSAEKRATGNDLRARPAPLAAAARSRIVYVRGDRTIQYGRLMDLLGLVN